MTTAPSLKLVKFEFKTIYISFKLGAVFIRVLHIQACVNREYSENCLSRNLEKTETFLSRKISMVSSISDS